MESENGSAVRSRRVLPKMPSFPDLHSPVGENGEMCNGETRVTSNGENMFYCLGLTCLYWLRNITVGTRVALGVTLVAQHLTSGAGANIPTTQYIYDGVASELIHLQDS